MQIYNVGRISNKYLMQSFDPLVKLWIARCQKWHYRLGTGFGHLFNILQYILIQNKFQEKLYMITVGTYSQHYGTSKCVTFRAVIAILRPFSVALSGYQLMGSGIPIIGQVCPGCCWRNAIAKSACTAHMIDAQTELY